MGAWALGHALGAIEETPEFPLRRADARHLPLKEVEELRSHCSPAGELPAERGEGALRRLGSPLRPGACAPVHLPLKRWRN